MKTRIPEVGETINHNGRPFWVTTVAPLPEGHRVWGRYLNGEKETETYTLEGGDDEK